MFLSNKELKKSWVRVEKKGTHWKTESFDRDEMKEKNPMEGAYSFKQQDISNYYRYDTLSVWEDVYCKSTAPTAKAEKDVSDKARDMSSYTNISESNQNESTNVSVQ